MSATISIPIPPPRSAVRGTWERFVGPGASARAVSVDASRCRRPTWLVVTALITEARIVSRS